MVNALIIFGSSAMSKTDNVAEDENARVVELRARGPRVSSKPLRIEGQQFEHTWLPNGVVLWGLRFGNYELIDPVSIQSENCNSENSTEESDTQYESNEIASKIRLSDRRAVVLCDELEVEAEQRRSFDTVGIPEQRFGKSLSEQCSLRFRYFTSWPKIDKEIFVSRSGGNSLRGFIQLMWAVILFATIAWLGYFRNG